MFGIASRSLVRRSEVSAPRTFETLNDCLKLYESNESVETKDLYNSFKFLTSNRELRTNALKDERLSSMLNQLDSRLGTLNSSYLGNFASRLNNLYNSLELRDSSNSYSVDQVKAVLDKMATTMVDKGGNVREIAQVSYALSSFGVSNHPIYEYQKQQMSLNIDSATPETINLCLYTAYNTNLKDRVYYALLCEKLSELTDRFTASDVVMTLKALQRIGLMKGFLLKRLLILMMDNLDQFRDTQLIESSYKFATLKFLSPSNFKRVYGHVKSKLDKLPRFSKSMMLGASYLCNLDVDNKDMHNLLDSLKADLPHDLVSLTDFVYASLYYKQYGDELQAAVTSLLSCKPFNSMRYSLLVKEALESVLPESGVKVELTQEWKDLFETLDKTQKEWVESQALFQEMKMILEQSTQFKPLEKVGPHLVTFVNHDLKACVEAEFGHLLGSSQLKLRSLNALGYKTALVRYWEWRQLKTETAQADYMSKLLKNLTN